MQETVRDWFASTASQVSLSLSSRLSRAESWRSALTTLLRLSCSTNQFEINCGARSVFSHVICVCACRVRAVGRVRKIKSRQVRSLSLSRPRAARRVSRRARVLSRAHCALAPPAGCAACSKHASRNRESGRRRGPDQSSEIHENMEIIDSKGEGWANRDALSRRYAGRLVAGTKAPLPLTLEAVEHL